MSRHTAPCRTARLAFVLGLALSLAVVGCADDTSASGDLTVFIVGAQPPAGHAPHVVQFAVDFPRGELDDSAFDLAWDFGDGATLAGQLEPSHTFAAPGEYLVSVTVTARDTGESGTDDTVITVYDSADLAVSGVEARPLQLQAGQNLQVLYALRSEAAAVRVPFSVVVFLADTDTVDLNDLDEVRILTRDVIDTMPGVGEDGAIEDFELQLRVPESVPSGEYFVGVAVDADAAIGELEEDDNLLLASQPVAVRNPATDGPDLVPTSVVVNPKRTRVLTGVSLDFTVENRGLSPALLFDYAVYMSPDDSLETGSDTKVLEASLPGVSTSQPLRVEDVQIPIAPPVSEPGDYTFFVVLDPRDDVTELDEDNNTAASANPVAVTDEPILDADIVVLGFDVSPDRTFLGGAVMATVELMNQGNQSTGSFICSIYFSTDQLLDLDTDLVLSSLNIFDLPGNTQQTAQGVLAVPSFFLAGDYWAFAACDASGVVVEFNEDNNVQRYPRQVRVAVTAEVDLTPQRLALNPPSPIADGTPLQLDFDLCNLGSTGSSPTLLRVFLSSDATPSVDDLLVHEAIAPGVDPEGCEAITAALDGRCVPWISNYQLLVQVDVRDVLDETNEGNNLGVLPGGLVIEGPFCQCTDDAGEPNNFPTVPFPLVVGSNPGFSLCAGDKDWFSVALSPNDSLRVTLRHDPAYGPLDVALLDPAMAPLEVSGESDGTEQVDTWLVPIASDYLIEVRSGTPGAINRYDLDVQLLPPRTGQADLAAVDVVPQTRTPNLNTPFTVALAVVNLGTVEVTTPFRVGLYLVQGATFDPATAVELEQLVVASLAGLQRTPLTRSVVIPGDTAPGYWRIAAVADVLDVVGEADETNNASVSAALTIDTTCFDPLEPNDTLASAVVIVPQTVDPAPAPSYVDLVVCKDNPDFYRVHADTGKALRFRVDSDAALGDLDLVLRNADGTELAASRTATDVEEIVVPVTVGDQDLFLEVVQHPNPFNAALSRYELTVTMVDADPSLVCNATFEPNDDFNTAASLLDASASPTPIAICPATDADYFRVNVAAATPLQVRVVTSSRHVRATLYDPARNFVQTIFDPAADVIAYVTPSAGTYTVKVFAGAGALRQTEYALEVTGVEGVDLVPTAFSLLPSVVNAGDPLQYGLTIGNPGTQSSVAYDLVVVLSTDAVYDASDLVLVALSGLSPLTAGGSVSLGDKVDVPAGLGGGRYYLGVVVDPADTVGELNEFNNERFAALDVVADCVPDAFELPDNDASARATDLDANAPLTASICPGDRDWFVLAGVAGQSVTVTASFTHAAGDLDLYIYDATLSRLADGRSVTDDEVVSVTPAVSGLLYIEVRGFTPTTRNAYSLDFATP